MGCWNHTCAVSNLHIHAGQDVVVFMLGKQMSNASFSYGNALYEVCPVPFYGKYDDYGGVEDCHGFGLNIVVEAMREQLYEFGQGPNEYHDIEVNRDNLDVAKMFEADHEDRLAIQYHSSWVEDSYQLGELRRLDADNTLTKSQQFELDRLSSKLKKQDTCRPVTHAVVHGDIFRSIMNDWYIEQYVGDGKGNTGYDNNYIHLYFRDIEATIPEYVRRIKSHIDTNSSYMGLRNFFEYRDSCTAGSWMSTFRGGESDVWFLIDVNDMVVEIIRHGGENRWDTLAKFAKEVLTAAWVNSFMCYTRKLWTKQTGVGSQSNDALGYRVLANSMLSILKAEQAENEEFDDEDETEESDVKPTYIEP